MEVIYRAVSRIGARRREGEGRRGRAIYGPLVRSRTIGKARDESMPAASYGVERVVAMQG
jgi:hypothetical protein